MKIKSLLSIYCIIFSSVYFIAGSDPNIGLEVVRDEPRHSIDIWVAATSQVWDLYDRGDNSSSYHGSGTRDESQDRDKMSDHERDMAVEGRHESQEKNDYTGASGESHGSQFESGPRVRNRISQPGVTFKSDGLFDSSASLSDWSVTDFCDAIIAQNEIRYQEFKESALWFSGNDSGAPIEYRDGVSRNIFIKRKLVEHIIRRYSLYENPAFIEVIKTLPFVHESISRLNHDIQKGNILTPDDHAVKSIRTLHEQFEKEKRYKEKREVLQNHHISEIIADQTRPSVTNPMYHSVDSKMQQLWDARHAAYEHTRNDPTSIVQGYTVPAQTHQYLLNHGINSELTHYYWGNAIQQQLHKEWLSIAQAFAKIDALSKGQEMLLDVMFKLIKEAIEYHYYPIAALASDYCNQALLIADKHLETFYEHCPTLLRYAIKGTYEAIKTGVVVYIKTLAAVTLGVYDGVKNVGYMAIHPIQTVEDMVTGMAHLGFILIRHLALMQEYLDLYEYYEPDPIKRAERDQRAREISARLKDDYKTVYEIVRQSSQGLDGFGFIRKGVGFATECIILHQAQTRIASVVKKTGVAGKISAKAKSTIETIKAAFANKQSARLAVALEGAAALLEAGGMTAEELALLNEAVAAAKAAEAAATAAANAGTVAKTAATTSGEIAETAATAVAQETAEVVAKAGAAAESILAEQIVTTGEKSAAEAAAKAAAEEAASKAATAAEKVTEKIAHAARTVEDIVKECVTMPQDRPYFFTKQYQKSGNYQKAIQDFESLCPKDVQSFAPKPRCKTSGIQGTLEDGRRVTVRDISSKEGWPTLEIQNLDNTTTKIRYIAETQI